MKNVNATNTAKHEINRPEPLFSLISSSL